MAGCLTVGRGTRRADSAGSAVDRCAAGAGRGRQARGALPLEVVLLQEVAEVLVAVGDHDLACGGDGAHRPRRDPGRPVAVEPGPVGRHPLPQAHPGGGEVVVPMRGRRSGASGW